MSVPPMCSGTVTRSLVFQRLGNRPAEVLDLPAQLGYPLPRHGKQVANLRKEDRDRRCSQSKVPANAEHRNCRRAVHNGQTSGGIRYLVIGVQFERVEIIISAYRNIYLLAFEEMIHTNHWRLQMCLIYGNMHLVENRCSRSSRLFLPNLDRRNSAFLGLGSVSCQTTVQKDRMNAIKLINCVGIRGLSDVYYHL